VPDAEHFVEQNVMLCKNRFLHSKAKIYLMQKWPDAKMYFCTGNCFVFDFVKNIALHFCVVFDLVKNTAPKTFLHQAFYHKCLLNGQFAGKTKL